ncbi:MAG TPA: hypothetical protein VMZ91_14745 [Candidatus Paceibacterota bacterium]|nr:hypothetical protein [Candidatus Paceibacterota bacterium]
MENNEEETPAWKLILIVFIIIGSLLIVVIALLVNLSAVNSITKLAQLPEIIESNYSDYGIADDGSYNCSTWEHFNGDCKIKCIKSCKLKNKNAGGNICVC